MLITGKGTSGSWQIRGLQLGHAMGARVEPMAPMIEPTTVMVKRGPFKHVIWDIVDSWPQPVGNVWTKAEVDRWFDAKVKEIQPIGLVAATMHMAKDMARYELPMLWVPHHARPGQKKNPIRQKISKIGYEGAEHYLGRWRAVIEKQCRLRGWGFVVNPDSLSDVDVLVALRDASGYAPKHYKSNVKLANAQGSGTPIICNRESGYLETCGHGECWADDERELIAEFDKLESQIERLWRAADMYNRRIELHVVAEKYSEWLSSF